MPYNSYSNLLEMTYLRDYASFVKNNRLNDLVPVYLMNLNSFKIPVLDYFKHLNEEQMLETAKGGILRLLTGLESGEAIKEVRQSLNNWKNGGLVGIPREAISLKDITLVYSAQKLSFQSFLPYYTQEVSVATQVVNQIEVYYKQVQEIAMETLESIRQEEQEKRQESEDKYQDLFENASDLIQIISPEGYILYVNKAWTDTLGYSLQDFNGKQIYDFIHESEKENFRKYRTAIINGEPITESIRTCLVKSNGEEVTVEGFTNCRYKAGKPQYTRGLFRDITQRLRQEKQLNFYLEQLTEREENLRNIIESAPDGIIVISSNNTILLWNPKAENIFGWQQDEVLGKNLTERIVPPHLQQAHNQGMKRFMQTRVPHILHKTIEVPAIHKNGHQFYISLTISNSKQGGNDTFIAFLRDITEQKKNELELDNKRRQLEKSNEELEQYAWLTSHDLKEPLRKILTFSDAILKKHNQDEPEKTLRYIHKIHNSAARMSELIEAVLQYSNITTQSELFEKTVLNKVVSEVIEDLEVLIQSKQAVIQVGRLPVISAIPVQMRQLFQNLISNAIKYSKENETPSITISCENKNDGFTIMVQDNGVGFDAKYADKIFHVFQRLLYNKTHEGTGIGLALCKKIAERHKGSIYAKSEPGKGATFVIHLPAQVAVSSPAT